MYKQEYEKPNVEIIQFDRENFITTSGDSQDYGHGHGHGYAWGYDNGNHYGHGNGHNPHDNP